MNGADVLVKCLEEEKVEVVFGYPGVAIAPFYNSILDSDIETVLVRTEQNAAHAASGMFRVSGKVGVCAVTSGPGATNLITGIATAFADSIPMVCITGQVSSDLLGSDVFQEADITGAVESFVKYSYLVRDVDDIPRIMKEAFYIANSGRRGPVLIDVPIDIQNANVKSFSYPDSVKLRTYKPTVKGNMVQLKKVGAEILKAKKPLIVAGGGVLIGRARKELQKFARHFSIPVVTTMMGKGSMPSDDRLFYGMIGNNGHPCANRAMKECDLLIMVGARVADRSVNQPEITVTGKVLVHMDVDPAEIGKNVGPHIPLVGDCRSIFNDMMDFESGDDHIGWIEQLDQWKTEMEPVREQKPGFIDPAAFILELTKKLPEKAIYVADVGQNQIWSCRYAHVKGGDFLTSGGMGTMGYSIPAAMGAKYAHSDREVIAVCGDGSFQMSMMELATMRQHGIKSKVIVLRNNYLGMVRQYQHFTYEDRYSVVDLSGSPDLEKMAQAYDMPFFRVDDPAAQSSIIDDFISSKEACLMEVVIDPMDLV